MSVHQLQLARYVIKVAVDHTSRDEGIAGTLGGELGATAGGLYGASAGSRMGFNAGAAKPIMHDISKGFVTEAERASGRASQNLENRLGGLIRGGLGGGALGAVGGGLAGAAGGVGLAKLLHLLLQPKQQKSAARGEQVLKLIQSFDVPTLTKAMPARTAQGLGQLSRLPNPLAKPSILPIGDKAQLRADWQPVLTKDVGGTQWNTMLATGKPQAPSATWLNKLQRSNLAGHLLRLRQMQRSPQ